MESGEKRQVFFARANVKEDDSCVLLEPFHSSVPFRCIDRKSLLTVQPQDENRYPLFTKSIHRCYTRENFKQRFTLARNSSN